MTAIGVIPARYASSRYPGKALAHLGGFPMVHHVYAAAQQASRLSNVLIATDSPRIAAEVASLGDKVILTSAAHKSGTDRVAEAARKYEAAIVVNIQGDEPQLQPEIIDSLVALMEADPDIRMGTVASTALTEADLGDPNVVKVTVSQGRAVSFFREMPDTTPVGDVMRHIGIYAFAKDFLLEFSAQPPSPEEIEKGLEQLRASAMGVTIGVITTDFSGLGIDTREQLLRLASDWQNAEWLTGA